MSLNAQMLAHLKKNVSRTTEIKAALLSELKATHITTEKDDELEMELDIIVAEILSGNSAEGFALMVSGKSGAGKTTILKRLLDTNPIFSPIIDEYGNELELCLRLKTPSGCNVKTLGKAILRATGFELEAERTEDYIWDKVTKRLQKRQTKIIVLDEFQHVVNVPSNKGYLHLSDTIKNLMQIDGWPVWLVLSGVPDIERFIERDPNHQVDRRAPVVHIGNLSDDEFDVQRVREIVGVLAETCNCEIGFDLEVEFVRKLMHGGLWRQGMTIQVIKNTLYRCMWDDTALLPPANANDPNEQPRWEVAPRHFAEGYQRLANCSPATNVFLSSEWWLIRREVDEDGNLVDAMPGENGHEAPEAEPGADQDLTDSEPAAVYDTADIAAADVSARTAKSARRPRKATTKAKTKKEAA